MSSPQLLRFLSMAALVAALGCTDEPVGPDPQASAMGRSGAGAVAITVMSRNVFIGFDGDAAIAALATGDPSVFAPVLQQAITTLENTDFAARAAQFADEIARTRPHVVGLQEVYAIHADLTPLGLPVVINLDYLEILQAALADRGLNYQLVSVVVDTDMQPFPGIELVDRDAMLVDADRVTVGPGTIAKTFEYNIGVIAQGIDKKAGYIAANLTIDGADVRVVSTHLESDLGPGTYGMISQLRAAQAMEIATVLGSEPKAIVIGDMNDDPGSLFYQVFTAPAPYGAGLTDAWATMNPTDPGFSAGCFGPALSDLAPSCDRRIDFALVRGLGHPTAGLLGHTFMVGLNPSERVQGPAGLIWPSDHAGLVADLVTPPAHGLQQ